MIKPFTTLAVGAVVLVAQENLVEAAGFLEDSTATVEMRNVYYSYDTRNIHRDTIQEWGQGFIFNSKSGYSNGLIGFGLDTIIGWGFKLDAPGPGSVFPRNSEGEAVDEFSHVGLTGKARWSKTELRIGTLTPNLPILMANDGRLLPQLFSGGMITTKDIDNVTLVAGKISRETGRMSSDSVGLSVAGGTKKSHSFSFGGIDYKGPANTTLQYYYAQLEDYYQQNFLGVLHRLELSGGESIKSDLRYFDTQGIGANKRGEAGYGTTGYTSGGRGVIDNRTWSAMFTYGVGPHGLTAGYQRVSDNSNFVQMNMGSLPDKDAGGTSLYIFSDRLAASFNYAGERTWLAQYDYDFAALGVPGLKSSLAYLTGDKIEQKSDAQEWERDLTLSYVIQSGSLKGVSFAWRNAMLRSEVGGDGDQNRLTLSYSLPLW